MNPDDVLGGHQWSVLESELDKLSIYTSTSLMNTDTYYLEHRKPSTQHGGSETVVSTFVVFRDKDEVMINDSEIVNKLSARMRWTYLMKEGWKQKAQ